MSNNLKPCAHCGGKAMVERDMCPDGYGVFAHVKCQGCGSRSKSVYYSHGNDCPLTYEGIRDAWNTRAKPKVKPLVWEECPASEGPALIKAGSRLGTYSICDDVDGFSALYLELFRDKSPTWLGSYKPMTDASSDSTNRDRISPLKDAAQSDNERRIFGALEAWQWF